MDVMTAASTHTCLTEIPDMSHQSTATLVAQRDDSLDSATYLGSVSVSESEQATAVDAVTTTPYFQYVENQDISNQVPGYSSGTVYVSPSLYPTATSPTSTTYFDTTTYTGLPTSTSATNASQLVSYAGSTFLIQPSPDGSSNPILTAVSRQDNDSPSLVSPGEVSPSHSLSYATRVSPATIQWLIANYETAEGVSLPRSTLYSHYLKHCNETKQDPVNAASFGKLIRSVFLGLRTRR